MENSKFSTNENTHPVIFKAAVPETLQLIKPGETAVYLCRELGKQTTVSSAVTRINKRAGKQILILEYINNGESYRITRTE